MPVLLEKDHRGERGLTRNDGARESGAYAPHAPARDCIDIAFVNNMPDAALEATERQFLNLLQSAAVDRLVRVRFYAVPEVPRSELGRRRLADAYSDICELWNSGADAVIVTGAEPRARALADEPYWKTLTSILGWAEENTTASIWSCLAAHAAALHGDGIERAPLVEKCSGVFECTKAAAHAIMRRVPARVRVPHSRCNGLSADALRAAGYEILTCSEQVGPDTFLRRRKSLSLCFQGHPEYDADTLLREFRRDVGRFLRGERETYPAIPVGYFDAATASVLEVFRARALHERNEALMESFPAVSPAGGSELWQVPAVRIVRNWLAYAAAHSRSQAVRTSAGRRPLARRPKVLQSAVR